MADDKTGGSGGRRRRRRKGRGRGSAGPTEDVARASESAPSAPIESRPKRKRSGRRSRGPAGQEARGPQRERPQNEAPGRATRHAIDATVVEDDEPRSRPAPLSDVDLGWDVAAPASPPAASIDDDPGRSLAATRETRWGDDGDAPEPPSEISADLPVNGSDDHDPASAFESAETDLGIEIASIAGVAFATGGKIYDFDAGDEPYAVGDHVSVEGDRGVRRGVISRAPTRRQVTRALKQIKKRVRPASAEAGAGGDMQGLAKAKECARKLKLDIKIFRVESGRGRTAVYFSCDKKTEQRELARELASVLGGRVELRQTGVRDEAKIVGGIGSCGLELCCTTWLPAFVPVSIKNAKDQGLVLNPTKVSGQCGRLKCCLVYEQATYAEARKGLPKVGKRVVTEAGEGRVVEVDVLKRRVRVNHGDGRFDVYEADAVSPLFPSQREGRPEENK